MWEKTRMGPYERLPLKHVHYHIDDIDDSASSMYEAGHSKSVLWDNPKG